MVSFFIRRPVFAGSIAIIMALAGLISLALLPIAQFPEIAPPQVVVRAAYPGASSQVVADSVTTPLEQQINGVPGMAYMSSISANDGTSTITVTFDVGYSLFRGPSSNVGGFIGFNYFRENKQAFGCTQIANPYSDCVPAIPNSILGITEDDKWYSFRVGLNGVVTVADRLKLTADVAYLPLVAFRGTDDHLLRTDVPNTVSPEAGNGQGVQLEAILSYAVSDAFNIGAGGRYWAMWAPGTYTNIFSTPCPCQAMPVRTERYGAFLQASYKMDGLK